MLQVRSSSTRACWCSPSRLRHKYIALHRTPSVDLARKHPSAARDRTSAGAAAAPSAALTALPEAGPGTCIYEKFASSVSGEWEGVCATFTASGEVVPLPERFVPGAFREWGVTVQDWQTITSTLAEAGEGSAAGTFKRVTRRMMPTVGCEADSVAYIEEGEADAWTSTSVGSSNSSKAGAIQQPVATDGSYFIGPAKLTKPAAGAPPLQLELCLALDPPPKDQRQRIRLVAYLEGAQDAWQVTKYDLHQERYDTPYRGKLELAGCGGGVPTFSQTPRLAVESLGGSWKATAGVTVYHRSTPGGELQLRDSSDAPVSRIAAEGSTGVVLLPLGVWARCQSGEAQDGVRLELGVVLPDASSSGGHRKVGTCTYRSTGDLESVVLGHETLTTA